MDFSNYKNMLVDDLVAMRCIISGLLRESGFSRISEAADGAEALRKLEVGDCQLIVSDWNMPNMTGLELLKAVRNSPELKHLPFLLVTAEARKDKIIEAAKAGADGYIVKPLTSAMLGKKIEVILKRKAEI
ncbi:response regulator [Rhodoferax sp. PAMC 29310]|uniref:response regulator n=1 Tax=Rhodoferax sp. PAMC 29310 TaxID=2822760 RepID=UPI001B32758C|nr:response regulator [Rhodoferax sp. PAMC 29310]